MQRIVLTLLFLVVLTQGGALAAQEVGRARPAASRPMPGQAALDLHEAAVTSTALAADSLGRGVEIEAARRIAPFDLEWGTP